MQMLQAQPLGGSTGGPAAPGRPRALVPDYGPVIAQGCEHLRLAPPRTLDAALSLLADLYPHVAARTGQAVNLGNLDLLLEPFVARQDRADDGGRLRAALNRFWQQARASLPSNCLQIDLGPDDGRLARALLRLARELGAAGPNLALRVDPLRTPDGLLREAVLTAVETRRLRFLNHPMIVADLGEAYGVGEGHAVLPRGGGCLAGVRLDLAARLRDGTEGAAAGPDAGLAADVEAALARLRGPVAAVAGPAGFLATDWLAHEGLVRPDACTATLGVLGAAEAARDADDPAASGRARDVLARVAELLAAEAAPHRGALRARPVLVAEAAGVFDPTGAVAPPAGRTPQLYRHIRAVAPLHRLCSGGATEVFRVDPAVVDNPQAVVAVLRGAFAEGVRGFAVDTQGSGYDRITGYLYHPPAPMAVLPPHLAALVASRGRPRTEGDARDD